MSGTVGLPRTELHSIRGVGGAIKAPPIGPGKTPENFSFNSIFIDKNGAFCKLL